MPDALPDPDRKPARAPSPAGTRRLLPIAVALACIGGQSAQLAHFLLVRHERCAAHDTLSHGDHAGHDHAAPGTDGPAPALQDQTAHAHEDCTVVANLREPAVQTAPVVASVPLQTPPPRTLAPPAAPTLLQAAALWRVAPKNSPPV